MISIDVTDTGVRAALNELAQRLDNMQPVMQAIGEDIKARARERFGTSTGPDGQRWAPNARATIEAFIASKHGYGKKGINKKGRDLAMGKKPLIGETGDLRRQFHVAATSESVTIGHSAIYAAIQQFGGKKADYPKLWGDIPARPFLPIRAAGELYPKDRDLILDAISDWLAGK